MRRRRSWRLAATDARAELARRHALARHEQLPSRNAQRGGEGFDRAERGALGPVFHGLHGAKRQTRPARKLGLRPVASDAQPPHRTSTRLVGHHGGAFLHGRRYRRLLAASLLGGRRSDRGIRVRSEQVTHRNREPLGEPQERARGGVGDASFDELHMAHVEARALGEGLQRELLGKTKPAGSPGKSARRFDERRVGLGRPPRWHEPECADNRPERKGYGIGTEAGSCRSSGKCSRLREEALCEISCGRSEVPHPGLSAQKRECPSQTGRWLARLPLRPWRGAWPRCRST